MISIRNLTKHFDGNEVMHDVSLDLHDGETLVLMGCSGCGKSVLLKHIIGILKPEAGQVIIDGEDITSMSEKELNKKRLLFGVLFQGAALFDSMTVSENVAFSLVEHTDLSFQEIGERVERSLDLVRMKDSGSKMPSELSGGMKKRVGLARAIVSEPHYMLYDEPTAEIDPIMADVINELIIDFRNRFNVTSLAVTHDIKTACKIADRIAMMFQGRIVEIGNPEEIKNSDNPVVQQFISGSSKGPICF